MYKVLLVDDEPLFLEYLKHAIDWPSNGFDIDGFANDGTEALEIINLKNPDIVILDIKMTSLDGLDVCKAVYGRPDKPEIIISTAYDEFSFAKEAIKNDVCAYLLKPFDSEELLGALNKCTDKIEQKRASEKYKFLKKDNLLKSYLEGNVTLSDDEQNRYFLDKKSISLILETAEFKKETLGFIDTLIHDSSSSKDRIYIDISEDILCIIFVYKKDQETYEDILQLLHLLEIKLGSQTQICAGIGSEAFNIEELRDSFHRSLDAFCSRISVNKSIVLYKDIENLCLCGKCYSAQEINMLVDSYINGNMKMSNMIIDRIAERLQNKRMSYAFFNELNYNLMNTLRLLNKEYSYNFIEKPEIKNLIYKLMRCKSIDEVNDMFFGLIGKIVLINPASEQTKAELLSKKIDNFISEAYNDKSLGIKKIAGELHYEDSYIRRVYKNTRNRNIFQTIEEIRMTKAVELIKKGTYRIQDIASMVGFSDQFYFSKKFKLYFGYTPSEFENHKYM